MPRTIQDVIPTPFEPPQQKAPIDVLRAVANLLGRQTNEKVLGTVRTVPIDDKLVHSFRARVPALDDYTFELFRVVQESPLRLYPVKVSSHFQDAELVATDEQELVDSLAGLFQSAGVRQAVAALLAQAG